MEQFPPPHAVFFEPLEERKTRELWKKYKSDHQDLEAHEIDAAEVYSVDEFSKQFETWITTKSTKRIRVLMVWHAHFLSLACQQVLRRWMEVKSFRSRIWFHIEIANSVQSAILSRCIVRRLICPIHPVKTVEVIGTRVELLKRWIK